VVENEPRPAPALERISTGVPELDEMLSGGLLPHRPYLLVGPPGSGKTTLALQFLIEGIRRGEEVLYVTLEEPPNEIRLDHHSMGPEFEQIHVFDAVPDVMRYERTPFKDIASVREAVRIGQVPLTIRQTPEFESVEVTMTSLQPTLRQEVRRRHYKRLVIDSLTALQFFCMPGVSETQGAQTFLRFLSDLGTTTILTLEVPGGEEESEEHLLARGELRLFRWEAEGKTQYAIGVEKFRGSSHDIHLHPYRISPRGLDINLSVTIPSGGVAAPAQAEAPEVLGVPPEEVAYEIRRSVLNLDQDIRDLQEVGVDVKPMHEGVRFVLTALANHRYDEALLRLRETRTLADRTIDAYHVSATVEQPKPPVVVPVGAPTSPPTPPVMVERPPPPPPEIPVPTESIPPPPASPIPPPPELPPTVAPPPPTPAPTPASPMAVSVPPSAAATPPPPPTPAIPPEPPATVTTPVAAPEIAVVTPPSTPVPPPPAPEPVSATLVHRFFRRAPKPTPMMSHPTTGVKRMGPPSEASAPVQPPVPPKASEPSASVPAPLAAPRPVSSQIPSRVRSIEPVPPLRPPPPAPATVPTVASGTTVEAGGTATVPPPALPAPAAAVPPAPPIPPGVVAEPANPPPTPGSVSLPLPVPTVQRAKRHPGAAGRRRKTKSVEPAPAPSVEPPVVNVVVTPPPQPETVTPSSIPPRRPPRRRRKAPPVTGADAGPMPAETPETQASSAGSSSPPETTAAAPPNPVTED
jgi:KaiC/GvpD/RAD55 family RecA-like ATPase